MCVPRECPPVKRTLPVLSALHQPNEDHSVCCSHAFIVLHCWQVTLEGVGFLNDSIWSAFHQVKSPSLRAQLFHCLIFNLNMLDLHHSFRCHPAYEVCLLQKDHSYKKVINSFSHSRSLDQITSCYLLPSSCFRFLASTWGLKPAWRLSPSLGTQAFGSRQVWAGIW